MQNFVHNEALERKLEFHRSKGRTIGFVPTMGALHAGHLKLVRASMKKCDVTVCSIFVNPTQFNDPKDLQKYPRNLERDKALLKETGLQIIFAPGIREIYPKNLDTTVHIDLAGLDKTLEGAFRPGHFEGVVQVVKRLLDIVRPDVLFMGQKDFQQFTIIRHLINTLKLRVQLEVIPTEREAGGLAMSSRNERLTREFRKKAEVIFETLTYLKSSLGTKPISNIRDEALKKITSAGLKPEYIELVDGHTLQPVNVPVIHHYIVGLIAAWAGDIRLIDNMILKE